MKIIDRRTDMKQWFKQLQQGDVFEYLNAFYIKTGLSENEENAVDLKNGSGDIISLNAEVTLIDATLMIDTKGSDF